MVFWHILKAVVKVLSEKIANTISYPEINDANF